MSALQDMLENDKKKQPKNAYYVNKDSGASYSFGNDSQGSSAYYDGSKAYSFTPEQSYAQPKTDNSAPAKAQPITAATVQNNGYFGNAYDNIQKMNREAKDYYKQSVDSSINKMTREYGFQKQAVEDAYKTNVEQLRANETKDLRALPEQMSKLGLYGQGVGETAISQIKNNYNTNLSNLLKEKNKSLAEIDKEINNLKYQAEADIYKYTADLMAQNPQLYLSILQNQRQEYESDRANYLNWESLKQNAYQYEQNYKADDYWKNKELEENKKKEAWQTAVAYGNYQPLVEMGILSQEAADNAAKSFKLGQKAQDIQNQLIIDNPYGIVKSSGGSSGGSKSSGGSSGGRSGGSSGGSQSSKISKEQVKANIDGDISRWLYTPYNIDGSGYYYNNWSEKTDDIYAARDKINGSYSYLKSELISAGYTNDAATKKMEEWKTNIAKKEADRTGKTVGEIKKKWKW